VQAEQKKHEIMLCCVQSCDFRLDRHYHQSRTKEDCCMAPRC